MEGHRSRTETSNDEPSTLPLHLQRIERYGASTNISDDSRMEIEAPIHDEGPLNNRYRHHTTLKRANQREPPASDYYRMPQRQPPQTQPHSSVVPRLRGIQNGGTKLFARTHQRLYLGMVGLAMISAFIMINFSIHVASDRNGMNWNLSFTTPSRLHPKRIVFSPPEQKPKRNIIEVQNSTFFLRLPEMLAVNVSQKSNSTIEVFELPTSNSFDPREDDQLAPTPKKESSDSSKKPPKCLPMADWMTASFPTCNSVHEIDMKSSVSSFRSNDEGDLKLLGQGWFRATWKYRNEGYETDDKNNDDGVAPKAVVLKTLRIEREFLEEYFDLHRRDAVAMERLTFSPYVVNVHGYCGQSAINELAEGIVGGSITNMEQLNRKMRGKEEDPQALLLKLRMATKVALGVAHVHNVHVSDNSGGRAASIQSLLYEHTNPNSTHSTTGFGKSISTMAHYDINPRNIAVMRDGTPKINDFNIAEFLTYNPQTNEPCGFRSRLHEPWWRAPEEMNTNHTSFVDEKVDIYALGEVLFHTLTTHGPRGKMKKERMDEVRALVRKGERPTMWEPYLSGGKDGYLKKNKIVRAFMKAMDLCFEFDPSKRGSAIQVARVLHRALQKEEDALRNRKNEEASKQEGTSAGETTSQVE